MTARRLLRAAALVIVFGLPGAARADAQAPEKPAEPSKPSGGTAGQDHEHQHAPSVRPSQELPPFIPPLTDEDREAAFPDVENHTVHDRAVHYFVLLDQLEWQGADGSGANWKNRGWVGGDVHRFRFRTEGEGDGGGLSSAEADALYGRAIHPWWDLVAGVRHDFRPGPGRTWAAVGVQGLAPYWFQVEATAYIGGAGRTHFRIETDYELLLTNRLILQPLVELEIHGKADPERGIGAGLSSTDAGLRLRYEIRREFAPYVGIAWNRKMFGTADLTEAAGEDTGQARLTLGVRVWF